MSNPRWVRQSVEIFDHPCLQSKEFDRRSAWMWLVSNAAWKEHKTRTRGGILTLKRGQVIAGLGHLSKTWGWSIKRVRTFLGDLAEQDMISKGQAKGQYAHVITISNYDKFQSVEENQASERANERQTRGKRGASEGQHSTKYTNIQNKKEDTREAKVIQFEDPHRRCELADGQIVLFNGLREFWLGEFEGDGRALDLALIQAAGYVQSTGPRPLEAQVGAQLARIVADRRDKDRRYAAAASRNTTAKPKQQSGSEILAARRARKLQEAANHG